jgi:predicted Zn-dependent protease
VQQVSAGRTDFVRNQDALYRAVDGLIYGDNPEQGIVRGTAFIHPPLRFRIDFPRGWDIQNSPEQVVAKAPGADVYMLLEQVEMPRGNGIENIARDQMQNAGFRIQSGARQQVNGLDAFIGLYQGSLEGPRQRDDARGAHRPQRQRVSRGGVQRAECLRAARRRVPVEHPLVQTDQRGRAESVHPNRVDIYVVREGDSWQSIAERSGGVIKPATLAIMNGFEPNSQPMVGKRIKIVVGG